MVAECIRYTVPGAVADEFTAAYRQAGRVLDADPHCAAYEVAHYQVQHGGRADVRTRSAHRTRGVLT